MSTASPIGINPLFEGSPAFVIDSPRTTTVDYQPGTASPTCGFALPVPSGAAAALVLVASGFGWHSILHRVDLQNVTAASPHMVIAPKGLLGLGPDAPLADPLARLKELGDGWADGDGLAPQLPALAWARDVGKELGHSYAARLVVAPTLEGGVVLERQIGTSRWSLDIDPDGDPFLVVVGEGSTETSEPMSPAAAAESFREFLTKPVAVPA
jgi:hypothetical protein